MYICEMSENSLTYFWNQSNWIINPFSPEFPFRLFFTLCILQTHSDVHVYKGYQPVHMSVFDTSWIFTNSVFLYVIHFIYTYKKWQLT